MDSSLPTAAPLRRRDRPRIALYVLLAPAVVATLLSAILRGGWWPPADHTVNTNRVGAFYSAEQLARIEAHFDRTIPDVPLQPLQFADDGRRVVWLGLKGSDWRLLAPLVREGRLPAVRRMLAAGAAGNLRSDLSVVDLSVWIPELTGMSRPEGWRVQWPGPHVWDLARQGGRSVSPLAHLSFGGDAYGPERMIEREGVGQLDGPPEFMRSYQACREQVGDRQPGDYYIAICLALKREHDFSAVIFRSVHNAADESLYDWLDLRAPAGLRMFGGAIEWGEEPDAFTQAQMAFDKELERMIDGLGPDTNLIVSSCRGFRFDGQQWVDITPRSGLVQSLGFDPLPLLEHRRGVVARGAGLWAVKARIEETWLPLNWVDQEGTRHRTLVHVDLLALSGGLLSDPGWFDGIERRLFEQWGEQAGQVEVIRWDARSVWIVPNEDRLIELIAGSRNSGSINDMFRVTINAGGQEPGASAVFLGLGPAFKPGARLAADARVEDMAPTVLYLLGLPVPATMQGRVLTEALSDELLAARPIQRR